MNESEITAKAYIFGVQNMGLSHVLLLTKKEIFYNKELNLTPNTFCDLLVSKIRKTMIKEKVIFTQNSKFDIYDSKWSKFLNIYDYRGPDNYEIF